MPEFIAEVDEDDVAGHGNWGDNANEPVVEDDVEGYGNWGENANEPVVEDDDGTTE